MFRTIATALIITFGILVMMFAFAFAVDHFDLFNRECCQTSFIQEVASCPFVAESATVTPTALLCEQVVLTGTLVVLTMSPTHDATNPPPDSTTTPNPTNTPNPTITSIPTSTPEPTDPPAPTSTPQPEPTEKVNCNKGGGNDDEGCNPGNNPCKGNDDEPDLCND